MIASRGSGLSLSRDLSRDRGGFCQTQESNFRGKKGVKYFLQEAITRRITFPEPR